MSVEILKPEYKCFVSGGKHSFKGAPTSDNIETFDDCGYLIQDNELVIDIDNVKREMVDALIKVFDIKTQVVYTDKGCHLYYLAPNGFVGRSGICLLGIPIEYKTAKNTPNGITIRRNGKTREIVNQGQRESLSPLFQKHPQRGVESLLGLGEGDGRNDKLFRHRVCVQTKFSKESISWETVIRFINEHIFDEPLDEKEFEVIIRPIDNLEDEELSKELIIAEKIMHEKKIHRYLGDLWYYDGKEYRNDLYDLRHIIATQYAYNLSTYSINEIVSLLIDRCKRVSPDEQMIVRFKNGFLENGEFYDFQTDDFTPYFINITYNPEAPFCPAVEGYLNHLTKGSPDYRLLFLEMLGYCFVTDINKIKSLAKFFVLVGGGGNGKGTVLQIIAKILGDKNVSALDLEQMTDDRYLCGMKGKLANLGDDMVDAPINEKKMKVIKNVTTSDLTDIRKLYSLAPDSVRFIAKQIFTSNHIIKSYEKSDSYKRRVVWLPMFTKVEKPDPCFIQTVTSDEALEYWIALAVDGYKRLYENEKFTESKVVQSFNDNYHRENDSTISFLDGYTKDDFLGKTSAYVIELYRSYCEENFENELAIKTLKSAIRERFGLEVKNKWINGVQAKRYVEVEDVEEEYPF